MPIWITVQKSLQHRRWKADCNCPKQADSQADGATVLQIRACKKCCRLWPLALKKAKRKKPEIGLITGFFDGGELGIRTLGTFLYTTFRVAHLRPLGQLSVYLLNCSFLVQKRFGENYRREREKIFDFNVLKPRWIKGFVRTKPPKLRRISSQPRYDHFDTSPYILFT